MTTTDYNIFFIDLPYSTNGLTILENDGFYSIYINARLDYSSQQKAINHELAHIKRHDIYKTEQPIENVEIYY